MKGFRIRRTFQGTLFSGIALAVVGCSTRPDRAGEPREAELARRAESAPGVASSADVALPANGRQLFESYCAICHGLSGDGRGEASWMLSPAPRDFTSGRFRLVSTANGIPSDEDLVATLRRGMPGSAMPAWEWMSAAELAALATYVRELAYEGMTKSLLAWAETEGEDLSEDEARALAREKTTPGPKLELGAPPAGSEGMLAHGKELYTVSCASCHGADGRARNVENQVNEDGTPTRPQDYTAGIFKGGGEREDIVRRLLCGIPGSPMPQTEFADPRDPWALASYVRTFVKPGVEERVLQHRKTLRARRVAALPRDPLDPAWAEVESTWIALMPLWWRDERIEGLELSAVHDGREIAFHLAWADATKSEELLGFETFTDAAALQFSAEATPPFFAMGEAGRPLNIWSWKAAWELEGEQARGIADRYPFASDTLPAYVPEDMRQLYSTARAAGNDLAAPGHARPVEELSAQGFGTLAPVSRKGGLAGHGVWSEGRWQVVFTRPLRPEGTELVPFEPGTEVCVGYAVWDGSAQDRNGQKSVSVWHCLEIER